MDESHATLFALNAINASINKNYLIILNSIKIN